MRDPTVWSYSAAMTPGKPVESVSVIGKVLKSDNEKIKEGQIVMMMMSGTESYSAKSEQAVESTQIIDLRMGCRSQLIWACWA